MGSEVISSDGHGGGFEFRPGPIFGNLILADEINRATPKTQSALLEAMGERTVSVGGTIRRLDSPFCVLATQNPLELDGTYPLPQAQLDRFMLKILLHSPGVDELMAILDRTTGVSAGATMSNTASANNSTRAATPAYSLILFSMLPPLAPSCTLGRDLRFRR